KQAKKQLESPDKQAQAKTEKKVFPQLESQFLKASKEQKVPLQVQANPTPPPFKIQWKNDEEKKILETKPKEEPKSDPKTTNTANSESYFSVQVGAFSTKASAEVIIGQLKKKYTVDVIQITSGGKSVYKVWVGKFKTRDEAVKITQKLNNEDKISKTIIVSSSNY
ncbi:MAG: hypothetical protein QG641_1896, partial [Candidatus Poribacteria bacterium]|nr:hypothetical protein [Candidatus Poribacteria bacterium]